MKDELLKPAINFFEEEKFKFHFEIQDDYIKILNCCYGLIDKFIPIIIHDLQLTDANILIYIDHSLTIRQNEDNKYVFRRGLSNMPVNVYLNRYGIDIYINTIIVDKYYMPYSEIFKQLISTLSHELRHIYQAYYNTYDYKDIKEYFNQDKEIDARAYEEDFLNRYKYIIKDFVKLYHHDLFEEEELMNQYVYNKRKIKNLNWKEEI